MHVPEILRILSFLGAIMGTAEVGCADQTRASDPMLTAPDSVKVATVAMHSEVGQLELSLERFEFWCRKASEAGATFAVFPEECLTGSLNKSKLTREESSRVAAKALPLAMQKVPEICRKRRLTVVVGIIEPGTEPGQFRNSALIVSPSGHLAKFTKLWLPNRTEEAWFEMGRELPVVTSQRWTFSVGICADIDRPEYFHAAFRNGADFMLLPIGGSGGAELVGADGDQTKQANFHKRLHMKFLSARARETGMYLFYANQAGRSGTDWFPGLALAIAPDGILVDQHLPTEGMTVTTVSRAAIANARRDRRRLATESAAPARLVNSSGESIRITLVREPKPRP